MDPEVAEQLRVLEAMLTAQVARTQALEAEVAQLTSRIAAAAPTVGEQRVQVKIEAATPSKQTLATGSGTPRAPAREAMQRVLPFQEPEARSVAAAAATAAAVQHVKDRQLAKAVKPERFSGSSKEVQNWLDAMESYLDALGLTTSPEGVATAITYLQGPARTWWRALPGTKEQKKKMKWDYFSEELLKQFQPYNLVKDARRKLRTTVQTTSVREYIARFRTVMLDIPDMPEAEQVWQFTEGLKSTIRVFVNLRNPKTMEEAFEAADTTDNSLFTGRKDRESSPHRAGDTGDRIGDSRDNPIVINKHEDSLDNEEDDWLDIFKKDKKKSRAAPERRLICWSCREEGHRAVDYPRCSPNGQ